MADLLHNHGTARRVPPADDRQGRSGLVVWLGAKARTRLDDTDGAIELETPTGAVIAYPGDWIIRTMGLDLVVSREGQPQ